MNKSENGQEANDEDGLKRENEQEANDEDGLKGQKGLESNHEGWSKGQEGVDEDTCSQKAGFKGKHHSSGEHSTVNFGDLCGGGV